MRDWACECSEDFGPCEDHCEVLAQREGASTRTADELLAVYIDDVSDILKNEGDGIAPFNEAMWEAEGVSARYWSVTDGRGGWLPTDDEAADDALTSSDMGEAARDAEAALPAGIWTLWDDGFRIVRVFDSCPLVAL